SSPSSGEPDRRPDGESAPMSALTSSLLGPSHPAVLGGTTVVRDEGPLPSPLPVRAEWFPTDGLRSSVKRAMDLTGALVGLLVFSPVMLVVALLIRLDSPGPALFRQVRRGHRGRPFRMLKFRTMVVDAERRLGDLESSNESAGGVLFKLRHDPRVTRLGRFLLRSCLDELPPLITIPTRHMTPLPPPP